MLEFILNNKTIHTDLPPGMLMLDFVRYASHLKGTKIGCREGDCGACTILVGEIIDNVLRYHSMTSCLMPIGNANGKHIVTVEGINMEELSPVQQAIIEEGGTQCGFCTVGFVMSLTGYCLDEKKSCNENAIAAIDGNICRCTGYKSLEKAAFSLTEKLQDRNPNDRTNWLIENKFIPSYFSNIKNRLVELSKDIKVNTSAIKVGGGTDLYVQKHDSMVHAEIDFMFDKTELNGIKKEGNTIYLGASVTVEDIRSNAMMLELFPDLIQHLKFVSSTPIRNMATIAGNFVNASPIGDMTIFFLALDASIVLSDSKNTRTIKLKDFYKGYKTLDKISVEFIEQIYFDVHDKNTHFNFEKVCKRTHLDIASANSAIRISIKGNIIVDVAVTAGGVFAYPLYLIKTSTFLKGKILIAENILAAAEILQTEISPITDARGDAEYKRLLTRQLFFGHFIKLFPSIISAEALLKPDLIS